MSCLKVNLAGVTLKNPVITASGCCGYGREYDKLYPIERLGGLSVKSTLTFGQEMLTSSRSIPLLSSRSAIAQYSSTVLPATFAMTTTDLLHLRGGGGRPDAPPHL